MSTYKKCEICGSFKVYRNGIPLETQQMVIEGNFEQHKQTKWKRIKKKLLDMMEVTAEALGSI